MRVAAIHRSWYVGYYAVLAVLVLGPLLMPGYVLTFDMAWTPHLPAPTSATDNGAVFFWLQHILGLLLPSMVVQKLLLASLVTGAGVGAHRLARLRWPAAAAYLAGTLAVLNPWFYTRWMAGQYLVLAGLALMLWLLAALWRLLERPSRSNIVKFGLWAGALGLVSIHDIALAALACLLAVAVWAWRRPAATWWPVARGLVVAAGIALLANAYWLLPFAAGTTNQAKAVAGFGLNEAAAFATQSTPALGGPLTVALLQGFWADPAGNYALPSSTGWLFGMAAVVLGGLGGWGLVVVGHRRDRLGLALAGAGVVAWFLAIGLAWPPSAAVTSWLMHHVLWYQGYRDTQKWAALSLIADVYLVAAGLSGLRDRLTADWRSYLDYCALLTPFLLVPMLLWGAGAQLRAVQYPADWYRLDQLLKASPMTGQTLLLPWHQYLSLGFTGGRLVANPAGAFLTTPTILSANPELPGVASGLPAAGLAARVENDVLARRTTATDLAARLHDLDISRVVLLKEADWADYNWLSRQPGLTLSSQTAHWQLWRVEVSP